MTTITAEDVVSGGGTFTSCLERAIRHPIGTDASTSYQFGHNPELDIQDWSLYHINYPLLSRTLSFFSSRRAGLRARLRVSENYDAKGNVRLTEEEFNAAITEYARQAPFLDMGDEVMEYAGKRALGREPPGGKNKKQKESNSDDLNVTDMLVSAACSQVPVGCQEAIVGATSTSGAETGEVICSPYLRVGGNTSVDDVEVTRRLSYLERTELSAVLDSEVERAASFYRLRITELSPPREDGGTLPDFTCGMAHCGSFELVCGSDEGLGLVPSVVATSDEEDDGICAPTQKREPISFSDMGSEILELHAFITTNIIVVRQVLIRYDAFVRSLGGSPMSSWYQTTRRQRKGGLSSDFRDLTKHSKLHKLTKAYIKEYSTNILQSDADTAGGRKKRRLRGLSKAFYHLVDSAEEIKKRQRLKWRQPAMNLEDEDDPEVSEVTAKVQHSESSETPAPTPIPTQNEAESARATPAPIDRNASVTPTPPTPNYGGARNGDDGEDIAWQVHVFKCIQAKTQRSVEKSETGKISGFFDNAIATLRDYFLLGSVSDNLSLMPSYLIMRGKSLKNALLVIAQWREQRVAKLQQLQQQQQIEDHWFGGFLGESRPKPRSSSPDSFSLFLNIFACFLYMMNYYIVEPSSTRYANALGSHDAVSGLIIGCMPWAAIVSAIVYSFWSNRCYRAPLITSGILLTAGNFLYASAYRRKSIVMALSGRFLTGLGGPRSMNRRYIADTTPLIQRTAVNAAFGTATALGAALGPATAILLDRIEFEVNLPLYGMVYFNGMTGPGYVMGLLWIVFTFILGFSFTEPVRIGLEEQRRKEQAELSSLEISSTNLPDNLSDVECASITGQPKPWDVSTQNSSGTFKTSFEFESLDGTPPEEGNSFWAQVKFVSRNLTIPVRISMFLLFSKMFTVETVISAASMVTKNRYGWVVHQVGTLGTIIGCLTIPISIFIGWLSQHREDRYLMIWLMSFAAFGMFLLVDISDFISTETETYNEGHPLAVGPHRYIAGYLLVFCSVQAFDGVVGSVLSKVIPTALATGTLNSGLLATVIGTFGRAVGDIFITTAGLINLRQIMNLLFVPSFVILAFDLFLIWWNYDILTA